MRVLKIIKKIGFKAFYYKLKRRVFIRDEDINSQIASLGAYDYMQRYQYAADILEETCVAKVNPFPNKIWTCWLQGIENAPEIIVKCIGSIRAQYGDDVIILSDNNIATYLDIPDYISLKREKGIINNTAYSDIIRIMIIEKYGGIWLDGTTWLFDRIPSYIENSNLFLYRSIARSGFVAFGLIAAKPQNEIISKTRKILLKYWEKENRIITYGVAATSFNLAVNSSKETYLEWENVINIPTTKHLLLSVLFKSFNQNHLDAIKQQCVIQHLSWKFPKENYEKKNTFYDIVIRNSHFDIK